MLKPSDRVVPIPLAAVLAAGVVMQFLSAASIWGHVSDETMILGRYSYTYLPVLGLHVGLTVAWLAALWQRRRLESWLRRLPFRTALAGVVLLTAAAVLIWIVDLRRLPDGYVTTNLGLAALALVLTLPDGRIRPRLGYGLIALALALMLIPTLFTALTKREFSPDEATWADYVTSPFVAGGLYARTWLAEPIAILPGIGWLPAGYGWLLEHVWYDIRLGRLLNILGYAAAFAGIGAAAWRLYGRRAALVSVGFALLSRAFFPSMDYRPDHQLPAASALILFTALQSRLGVQTGRRLVWDMLCGLLAVLSLQAHAAGIVYVVGFSLYYGIEAAARLYRRQPVDVARLAAFGAGLMTGGVAFYLFNILPVGGLERYLDILIDTRYSSTRKLNFLGWVSGLELPVVWGALAYLLWRRDRADKLLLGMIGAVWVGILLFDTQGYVSTFTGLYIVPVGALLVDGLRAAGIGRGENRRSLLAAAVVTALLIGQMSGAFITWDRFWQTVTTGRWPPFLYHELRQPLLPLLREDDVIVSTHQLIWTLPSSTNLVSFAAEASGMKRWKLSEPVEVWEQVQPTVVIEVRGQMHFDPGLQAYMAQEAFQPCQTLTVLDTDVVIYRQVCDMP